MDRGCWILTIAAGYTLVMFIVYCLCRAAGKAYPQAGPK